MLTPEAIKILRKVQEEILKEPYKFRMEAYFSKDRKSPCGTAACIAGWIIAVGNQHPNLMKARESGWNYADEATSILKGNDTSAGHNPVALFFMGEWPYEFEKDYGMARTRKGKAVVAANRIDHFIETGE
jgi:hypothetical protein